MICMGVILLLLVCLEFAICCLADWFVVCCTFWLLGIVCVVWHIGCAWLVLVFLLCLVWCFGCLLVCCGIVGCLLVFVNSVVCNLRGFLAVWLICLGCLVWLRDCFGFGFGMFG